MKWLTNFLTSSIGQKLVMSLTGLFLVSFLLIHLLGNLLLLASDGGEAFNTYAYFMTHNPLIKTVSYGLYFFILAHAVQGFLLWFKNRSAKGSRYAVSSTKTTTLPSRHMALLGTFILAFLFIHMGDFWFKMKTEVLPMVEIAGFDEPIADLYFRVAEAFKNPLIVAAYVFGQLVLAMHLWHGFQSAFQTLGLNHKKYTPAIAGLGKLISIVVPAGFAIIPLYHYFIK
ncbi:MAG: succinate dehydrogenase / fumarate reductase cytochrome b subunit [Polaribacter sp.]|jgi:succinate dehydrogenase / fumarate reductase cytochrome b subunit